MRLKDDNPWSTRPKHHDLVDLGTHRLWASVSGPFRQKRDDVLVIFIPGAGASCSAYIKLQQELSHHVRVLFYDRAGYDRSTIPSSVPRDRKTILARDTALDLQKLLAKTQLEPPYVIAGHSFGGIIARAFLEVNKDNIHVIAGVMLLDTATELMLEIHPRIPPLELMAVAKNVDWEAMTHFQEESGMTQDEWDYVIGAQERCIEALKLEDTHGSGRQLAEGQQTRRPILKHQPLDIVSYNMAKDYQMMYDAGVELGDGTEAERQAARAFIEKFKLYSDQIARAQLFLSKDSTYHYREGHHDLPLRQASLAATDIMNVVRRAQKRIAEDVEALRARK